MAKRDHRIIRNGQPVDYTCQNHRFMTKDAGKAHAPNAQTGGSVTGSPLIDAGGYSLWLEHVEEKGSPNAEWYWLMWYDAVGVPTLPASSVFTRDQLADMVKKLVEFMP